MAKRVAIDTVPLPEKALHMKVVKGMLQKSRSKYFLKLGRRSIEIEPGALMPEKAIAKLAGQEVYAAFSGKGALVAIGTWPTPETRRRPPRWIVCNIPVPDLIRATSLALRQSLIKSLREKGIITKELARVVEASLDAGF